MTSTAVVRTPVAQGGLVQQERKELAALFTPEARAIIEPLLPAGVALERIGSEVWFAMQDNPTLARCTPSSLVQSVGRSLAWGLEIGRTVHLVPFGDKCQAIRDYKGDIQLVVQSGAAIMVDAKAVYANEFFEWEDGTAPFIKHKPILDKKGRGAVIAFYAWARVTRHETKIFVISAEDVDDVRRKYSKQWKTGTLDAIAWYGCKTAVKRLCKQLPMRLVGGVLNQLEREELELLDGEIAGDPTAGDGGAAVMAGAHRLASGELEVSRMEEERGDAGTSPAPTATPDSSSRAPQGGGVGAATPAVVPPQPAAAAPTAPAGRPVLDDNDRACEPGTLEWALNYPLPFRNSAKYQLRLGKHTDDELRDTAELIRRKQQTTAGWHQVTLDAIGMVLASREPATADDDDDDLPMSGYVHDPVATLATPPAPVSGSGGSVKMPPPGAIADADPVPQRDSVEWLKQQAAELLAQVKAKDGADVIAGYAATLLATPDITEQQLRKLIGTLSRELETPF